MSHITEDHSITDSLPFGLDYPALESLGALQTAREIAQQPRLWLETWKLVCQQQTEITRFLTHALSHPGIEIILTGAGTSAYIGDVLHTYIQKETGKNTSAIPTTDLLSHPSLYFNRESILLVSFARSGNSPESIAAVNLATACCPTVFHLIITCNADGKLATDTDKKSSYLFLLPKEADDQSVAMTSSFTSMLLAGVLIARIAEVQQLKNQVKRLCEYGKTILNEYSERLKAVADLNFDRAVFLGSGPYLGCASESDLKLVELTGGKVICRNETFLGFRHGPKIMITPTTLLVFLFSNAAYAHQYETDLVKDINAGEKGIYRIGVSEAGEEKLGLDLGITLSDGTSNISEDLLAVAMVLPAQIIAFFKSIQVGLKPDNSAANGTITRVVQGVHVYPFRENDPPANRSDHYIQ